jgi:hypothetical protein
MPPAVTAGAARGLADEDETTTGRSTDDGVPVGAADAEADARRSGAGADDQWQPDVLEEGSLGGLGAGGATDDGVPVGAADAEADRQRATEQDDAG